MRKMDTNGATVYRKFSVGERDGGVSEMAPIPEEIPPRWARDVSPKAYPWKVSIANEPFFAPPIHFVVPPPDDSGEQFFRHNHCPAIAWCPNGDLLAAWFSCEREHGTEMTILAGRLRAGATAWEPSAEFFKSVDRNMTGTALLNDGRGTLYHFNGMGPAGVEGWENLVVTLRASADNGVHWTPPRVISPQARYQRRNQVIAGTSITPDGLWLQPCDGTPAGEGPSAIHVSPDDGNTWIEPGGDIRGIHAGVVALKDGRLLAFGRAQALDGRMPASISSDLGKSWNYRACPFPPISSGQRLVLTRLREGPLLLVSFTDPVKGKAAEGWRIRGMELPDADGMPVIGYGMFASLSYDEGDTWPVRKLLTPGRGEYDGGAWTGRFTASPTQAEPMGYLAATQTPDGIVHLVSSRLHYRFNLAWLEKPQKAI